MGLLVGFLTLLLCQHVLAASMPAGAIVGTGYTVGFGELKEEWRGEIIHLSWSPRAFLLKKFLSDEECDHLISMSKSRMEKSTVVDNDTGKSVDSNIRTSTGTFLLRGEDAVVKRIEKRVAQVTMIPEENQENMQILHYQHGQKYEPHHDYFYDQLNTDKEHGGQRVVTILMYLTTVEKGGETVFPDADKKTTGPEWSDCAKKGLAVKTVRGDALMFYGLQPDGALDPHSLHASCPVIQGEKWSATKWIHVAPHMQGPKAKDSSGCTDDNEQCKEWAFFGECEKNPSYMLATCKRSCGKCPGIPKVAARGE